MNRPLSAPALGPLSVTTTSARFPGVRKIAVLRANALGDFIVALPALEALRAAYPDAEMVLLGRDWHRSFLDGRPGPIDRVVVVPPYPGVTASPDIPQSSQTLDAFFARMRDERFDLAVQIHGGGRHSNPFIMRLGARHTVGLRAADAPALDRCMFYGRYQHEILRFLDAVRLAGAESVHLEPHLAVTDADGEESLRFLPAQSSRLLAIHPGATDAERVWPSDRFAAIADRLAILNAQILLVGDNMDRPAIDSVLLQVHVPVRDLGGCLSLRGLAGLLSRCDLMLGNDSGPRHLAAAVGTPTVGLYSFFNLINYGPLSQEWHRPVVSWRRSAGEGGSYLTDVTVDEVEARVLEVWEDVHRAGYAKTRENQYGTPALAGNARSV